MAHCGCWCFCTFYKLGYSPFQLSFLFLLYEAAGILANLIGGWLATRFGIARMLTVGLSTQILGFSVLSMLNSRVDGRDVCCLGSSWRKEFAESRRI